MLHVTPSEAGRRLAVGLGSVITETPVVVAISPGAVAVATEIAEAFDAPVDVLGVCRLEVPGRTHSTFGAVARDTVMLLEHRVLELGLPQAYVDGMIALARQESAAHATAARGGAPEVPVTGRTVVLADDGHGDAVYLTAAARALREAGARKIIFVAPTASGPACAALREYVDSRLLLHEPDTAGKVITQTVSLAQITRAEAGALVRRSRPKLAVVRGG